jgi:hypothetical protein
MPHFEQLVARSLWTSGCIGQTYVAMAFANARSRPSSPLQHPRDPHARTRDNAHTRDSVTIKRRCNRASYIRRRARGRTSSRSC